MAPDPTGGRCGFAWPSAHEDLYPSLPTKLVKTEPSYSRPSTNAPLGALAPRITHSNLEIYPLSLSLPRTLSEPCLGPAISPFAMLAVRPAAPWSHPLWPGRHCMSGRKFKQFYPLLISPVYGAQCWAWGPRKGIQAQLGASTSGRGAAGVGCRNSRCVPTLADTYFLWARSG